MQYIKLRIISLIIYFRPIRNRYAFLLAKNEDSFLLQHYPIIISHWGSNLDQELWSGGPYDGKDRLYLALFSLLRYPRYQHFYHIRKKKGYMS